MVQRRTYTCWRRVQRWESRCAIECSYSVMPRGQSSSPHYAHACTVLGSTSFAQTPLSKRENTKVAKAHQIKVSGPGQRRMIRGSPLQNFGANHPCKHEEIAPRNLRAKEALEDIRKSVQEFRSPSNGAREEKISLRTVEPKQRRKRRQNPSEHLRARATVQLTQGSTKDPWSQNVDEGRSKIIEQNAAPN